MVSYTICLAVGKSSNDENIRENRRFRTFLHPRFPVGYDRVIACFRLTCDHRVPISRRIHGGGSRSRRRRTLFHGFSRDRWSRRRSRFTAPLSPPLYDASVSQTGVRGPTTERLPNRMPRRRDVHGRRIIFRKKNGDDDDLRATTAPGTDRGGPANGRVCVCSARGNRFAGPIPRRLRRL